eukprot:5186658-Prymnesium_polylepis.1
MPPRSGRETSARTVCAPKRPYTVRLYRCVACGRLIQSSRVPKPNGTFAETRGSCKGQLLLLVSYMFVPAFVPMTAAGVSDWPVW